MFCVLACDVWLLFPRYRKYIHVVVVFGLDGLSPIGVWDVLEWLNA